MEINLEKENKTVKKKNAILRILSTIDEIFSDMMENRLVLILSTIVVVGLMCIGGIQAYSAFYYRDDVKWCTLHVRDSVFKVVDTQTDIVDASNGSYKVIITIQNIDTKDVGSIELKNESYDKISDNYKKAVSLDAGDTFMIEDKTIKLLGVDS